MGIELVKLASHHHRGLAGNPYKDLIAMCAGALDRPSDAGRPARIYFGGWERLAFALGRDVPDDDGTAGVRRDRLRSKEHVRRAVQRLVDAGAVERLTTARQGERQTYRLTFPGTPAEGPTWDPSEGSLRDPGKGSHLRPLEGGTRDPLKGSPRNHLGGTEDSRQDFMPHGGLSSHPARDRQLDPHDYPLGADQCDQCALPAGNAIHRARRAS